MLPERERHLRSELKLETTLLYIIVTTLLGCKTAHYGTKRSKTNYRQWYKVKDTTKGVLSINVRTNTNV